MPQHTLTSEELFCLEGCRSYKQYLNMRKDFEEMKCTFCNLNRDTNKVLFEDEFVYAWLVPKQYHRKELAYHALFVPKRHIRFEIELTDEECLSIKAAKQKLHTDFGYKGGNTHVREGDMSLNAGTVPHLHYNTFQPNQTGEVRIPVFKDPSDREANLERSKRFARFYEEGVGLKEFENMVRDKIYTEDGKHIHT